MEVAFSAYTPQMLRYAFPTAAAVERNFLEIPFPGTEEEWRTLSGRMLEVFNQRIDLPYIPCHYEGHNIYVEMPQLENRVRHLCDGLEVNEPIQESAPQVCNLFWKIMALREYPGMDYTWFISQMQSLAAYIDSNMLCPDQNCRRILLEPLAFISSLDDSVWETWHRRAFRQQEYFLWTRFWDDADMSTQRSYTQQAATECWALQVLHDYKPRRNCPARPFNSFGCRRCGLTRKQRKILQEEVTFCLTEMFREPQEGPSIEELVLIDEQREQDRVVAKVCREWGLRRRGDVYNSWLLMVDLELVRKWYLRHVRSFLRCNSPMAQPEGLAQWLRPMFGHQEMSTSPLQLIRRRAQRSGFRSAVAGYYEPDDSPVAPHVLQLVIDFQHPELVQTFVRNPETGDMRRVVPAYDIRRAIHLYHDPTARLSDDVPSPGARSCLERSSDDVSSSSSSADSSTSGPSEAELPMESSLIDPEEIREPCHHESPCSPQVRQRESAVGFCLQDLPLVFESTEVLDEEWRLDAFPTCLSLLGKNLPVAQGVASVIVVTAAETDVRFFIRLEHRHGSVQPLVIDTHAPADAIFALMAHLRSVLSDGGWQLFKQVRLAQREVLPIVWAKKIGFNADRPNAFSRIMMLDEVIVEVAESVQRMYVETSVSLPFLMVCQDYGEIRPAWSNREVNEVTMELINGHFFMPENDYVTQSWFSPARVMSELLPFWQEHYRQASTLGNLQYTMDISSALQFENWRNDHLITVAAAREAFIQELVAILCQNWAVLDRHGNARIRDAVGYKKVFYDWATTHVDKFAIESRTKMLLKSRYKTIYPDTCPELWDIPEHAVGLYSAMQEDEILQQCVKEYRDQSGIAVSMTAQEDLTAWDNWPPFYKELFFVNGDANLAQRPLLLPSGVLFVFKPYRNHQAPSFAHWDGRI
jgi:hypothetical protein